MKHTIVTSALFLTVGLVAAGCGGSDSDQASTASSAQGQQAPGGAGQAPGGSGEVTEVSGSTAQVEGQGSQVAVMWTDSTTFTQQVAATAADVTVGSCVLVTSSDASDTAETNTVAGATVRLTEAVDGSCDVMGGGGGMPSGQRPTDMPTDMPSGAPGGGRPGGFAVGEVTAVTGGGFTVESQLPGSDTATTVAVTTSADTAYSTTAAATADDVVVGVCVTSRGEADDTGAITAMTIAVTQPVDGACTGGLGGFGGGRPAADAS